MRSFRILLTSFLVFLGLCLALDTALYPCTLARNDLHGLLSAQVDDVYLGTSHGKFNIDPTAMGEVWDRTGFNAASGNEYPVDSYYLASLLVEKGLSPRRIVYVTTPEYFCMEKEEGHNYLLFYHEFPLSLTKLSFFASAVAKTGIRSGLFPWHEYSLQVELPRVGENLKRKLSGDYGIEYFQTERQAYQKDGHMAHQPEDPSTFSFVSGEGFTTQGVREENLEWIRRLIALCRQEGIEFVSIMSPQSEPTLKRYKENYEEAQRFFSEFYAEQGVRWINFNGEKYYNMAPHDVRGFTDLDGHLNQSVAAQFSKMLTGVLGE